MNQQLKTYLVILGFIILSFIGGLFVMYKKKQPVINENKNLIESLNDTVKTWRDKDSLSHSKISTLQTARVKDFLTIQSKDKVIQDLQTVVSKNKNRLGEQGSVTNFTSTTKADITIPTKIENDKEIKTENKSVYIYPTYRGDFNLNGWITGSVVANKDSIKLKPVIRNKYSLIIGEEGKFLQKKKPFGEIINYNPYTESDTVRVYQVKDNRAKVKLKFGGYVGYGVTLNKGQIVPGPQAGAGLNINF